MTQVSLLVHRCAKWMEPFLSGCPMRESGETCRSDRCGRASATGSVVARCAHVHFAAEAKPTRPTLAVEREDDSLALAQHAEDRSRERVRGEVVVLQIGVADDDAVAARRIERLDDALHEERSAGLDD